jgi:hypothetical protein
MVSFYAEISSSLLYFILFNKIKLNGKLKPTEIKYARCNRSNVSVVPIHERYNEPSSKHLHSRNISLSQTT